LREQPDNRDKLNAFIEADYQGDLEVLDAVQVLRDEIGFDRVAEAVKRPLTGLRVASFYGCMVLRPPEEVAYDDPENPHVLDDLVAALGAEPVDYPHKTECCGAYLAVKSPEATNKMVYTILASAKANGAEAMITNCPLCQYNLDFQQTTVAWQQTSLRPFPIFYFSQLLGLALGLDVSHYRLDGHYVDPRPLLESKGLL